MVEIIYELGELNYFNIMPCIKIRSVCELVYLLGQCSVTNVVAQVVTRVDSISIEHLRAHLPILKHII